MSFETENNTIIFKVHSSHFGLEEVFQITKDCYEKIEELNYPKLIVDLLEVHFLDSSAIGFIINLKKLLERNVSDIALLCIDEKILDILTMVRIEKLVPIFSSREEAHEYFSSSH